VTDQQEVKLATLTHRRLRELDEAQEGFGEELIDEMLAAAKMIYTLTDWDAILRRKVSIEVARAAQDLRTADGMPVFIPTHMRKTDKGTFHFIGVDRTHYAAAPDELLLLYVEYRRHTRDVDDREANIVEAYVARRPRDVTPPHNEQPHA
jgi:hypothetical protein